MKYCMGCMEQYEDEYQVCPHCGYVEGTLAEESYYMEPGTILNKHYIVGRVIGTGGFGTTYIGWDYELGRKVAIKEYLPKEFSTRVKGAEDITIYPGEKEEQFQAGIEKFIEEARRLVKFKSIPGIVKFYNCFEENRTAYIIMEYLEGETLKEYLVKNSEEHSDSDVSGAVYHTMPYEEARTIMDRLLDALEGVHREGIIHRDIAPDNVFITKDGKVKLIDFGSSRFATTRHSRSLTVLIKEGYAPQEQYRSRGDQGPWTDVYSVAATFYTMVTGCILQDAMEREGNDLVKPPSKLGIKRIPKHVENAVMNALNRKIEDRTQNCEEFKKQLSDENTKWNFIRQRKVDIGKWPLWLKVTSGAGGAAVASFIILLITGVISFSSIMSAFVSRSEVPFVVGDTREVAEETLNDAGFECVYANYVEDETIAKDCIFNQMPGANEELAKGEAVYLTISCGSIKKEMPNLIGYDAEKAQQIMSDLKLSNLEVKTISVSDEKQIAGAGINTVVRQLLSGTEIPEGTEVNDGMVVTLEVAAETKSETGGSAMVPNLIGQSFSDAKGTVSQSRILIRKVNAQYSDQPKDTVLEQSMAAGETVEQGQIIDVTVSAGSDITVGIYQGKKKEDVVIMLQEAGIQAEWSEQESKNVPAGRVISQSVEPGEKIKYSDKLKLVVSTGSKDVKVDEDKINEMEKNPPPAAPTAPPKKDSKPDDIIPGDSSDKSIPKSTPKSIPKPKPTPKPTKAAPTSVPKTDIVVAVPDVKNKNEAEARKALEGSKLNCKVTYEFSESVSEGNVISQNPASGQVTEGTVVSLVVSKGKKAPDGWTEETGFSSKWYDVVSKTQYYEKSRDITEYIEWDENNLVKYTSKQKETETFVYVKEGKIKTGSHEEWCLKRWWNGATFKDKPTNGYDCDARWIDKKNIWAAAVPRWAKNRWHIVGDSEDSYPFVHDGTRSVDEYTTYYYYKKGINKTKTSEWSSSKWVDSKKDDTNKKEYKYTDTRTIYMYSSK